MNSDIGLLVDSWQLFNHQDFGDGVASLMKEVQDVSCGQFNGCCHVGSITHNLRLRIVVLDIDRRCVDTAHLYQPNFQPNM
jgi:hypothetical protein